MDPRHEAACLVGLTRALRDALERQDLAQARPLLEERGRRLAALAEALAGDPGLRQGLRPSLEELGRLDADLQALAGERLRAAGQELSRVRRQARPTPAPSGPGAVDRQA